MSELLISMEISLNNRSRSKIDEAKIRRLAEFFCSKFVKDKAELSIAFIGDKVMRRLNREYRASDRVTDILSFDGDEESLGEIIIDISQVKRQKAIYSSNFEKELLFILSHGLFHLIGYDDCKEAERIQMIELGRKFMDDFYKSTKFKKI